MWLQQTKDNTKQKLSLNSHNDVAIDANMEYN